MNDFQSFNDVYFLWHKNDHIGGRMVIPRDQNRHSTKVTYVDFGYELLQ